MEKIMQPLTNLNIIADENLALTDYFFNQFGHIKYLAGRKITPDDVKDADVLLVRSVTKVNRALLAGSKVKFVGSATIGTDHVEQDYLAAQGITFANAAGCNAQAVAEYVITAILTLHPDSIAAGQDFCLSIVGLGNVGTRLARLAQQIGWRVIGTDPHVTLQGIENVSLSQALQQADALSLHVPLTRTGSNATYHLLNVQTLQQLESSAILINSARGEVISEQALMADIEQTGRQVVLDVFEHEPVINQQLLNQLALATPHIAGYSLEGKARGTQMIYDAFCHFYNQLPNKNFTSQLPEAPQWFNQAQPLNDQLLNLLPQIYPISTDDQALRNSLNAAGMVEPESFDLLRKHYLLRREWSAYGWQNV